MMPPHLIISIIIVVWIKGVYLSKEKQIFQTPADLFMRLNTEAKVQPKLNLTHQIPSYDTVLWYLRSAGDNSLQLIGYVYFKTTTVETPFKNRFDVSGDGEKTAFLHILSPKYPEDCGEYFGAARIRTGGGSYPAYFGEGTKLTVLEEGHDITPPKVNLFSPSEKECLKDNRDKQKKKTLVCLASDFYPDHVTVSWLHNGEVVTDGVATDAAAERDGKFYRITSRLTVPIKMWFKTESEFTCNVNFYNGSKYTDHTASITGEKAPDVGVWTNENYSKMVNKMKLSYVVITVKSCAYGAFIVFLVWKLQGSKGK